MTKPMKPQNYKQTVAASGLGVIERAVVFGVSRQTINRWDRGLFPNSPVTVSSMNRILRILARAVEAKLLPIPSTTPKEKRKKLVQTMRDSAI